MKNLQNVKTAAKNLNVAKGKIKDMIKSKKINFTLENGHYMVDVNEIKNILENNNISNLSINSYNKLNSKINRALQNTLDDYEGNTSAGAAPIIQDIKSILELQKFTITNCAYLTNYILVADFHSKTKLAKQIAKERNIDYTNTVEYEHDLILKEIKKLFTIQRTSFGLILEKKHDEVDLNTLPVANTTSFNSHTKSPHEVKGHWRNQPYGPRNNPKYKKIWIEEFDKGVA